MSGRNARFFMNNLNKGSRRLNPEFQVKITGEVLRQWMILFAASVKDAEARLTELDSAIGDGDHGVNMRRGMDAVAEKLDALALADLSGQMRIISTTLMSSVGGAAGPLYGAFFLQSSHATLHKSELGPFGFDCSDGSRLSWCGAVGKSRGWR